MPIQKTVGYNAPEGFPGQIGDPSIMKTVGAIAGDANVKIGNGLFSTDRPNFVKGIATAGDRFVGIAIGEVSRATITEGLGVDAGNMLVNLIEGDVFVLVDTATVKMGDFVFCSTTTGDFRTQATNTAIAGTVLTPFRVQRVLNDNIVVGKKMVLVSTAFNASAVV